jgi:hypothetical protein
MKLLSVILLVCSMLLLMAALGPEMAVDQTVSLVIIKKQIIFLVLGCSLLLSSILVGCFYKLLQEMTAVEDDK